MDKGELVGDDGDSERSRTVITACVVGGQWYRSLQQSIARDDDVCEDVVEATWHGEEFEDCGITVRYEQHSHVNARRISSAMSTASSMEIGL